MSQTIGIIVGLDLVGDALIKLPFLRALRAGFPHARIVWITAQGKTAYAGALKDAAQGLIDEIWETPAFLPSRRNPKASVRDAPRFSILIDTRNRLQEALRVRRLPHDVFIAPATRWLWSDRRPPDFWRKKPHLVDRLLQMAELAAGKPLPATGGRLALPPESRERARHALPDGPVYAGFAPGAGNPVKIWPPENFIAAATAQKQKGRVPVFILGPRENGLQPRIVAAIPEALFPLQDHAVFGREWRIADTIALGERLKLAVVNDSGASHMLAAADCPLVSLFGPTDPAKLAPRVSKGIVLRARDYGGAAAMDRIPVASVVAAVDSLCQ